MAYDEVRLAEFLVADDSKDSIGIAVCGYPADSESQVGISEVAALYNEEIAILFDRCGNSGAPN